MLFFLFRDCVCSIFLLEFMVCWGILLCITFKTKVPCGKLWEIHRSNHQY